jgi:hypothetical protein
MRSRRKAAKTECPGVVREGRECANSKRSSEVINSAELAQRLKVKESWVVDQSKRSRTSDPIPIFRLGKHRRYRWARLRWKLGSTVALATRHNNAGLGLQQMEGSFNEDTARKSV